jgi:hypothetical protein
MNWIFLRRPEAAMTILAATSKGRHALTPATAPLDRRIGRRPQPRHLGIVLVSVELFIALKLIGAAYLVWIGFCTFPLRATGRRPQHFDYKDLHATIRIAHGLKMFVVTEAQAAMIRATYEQRGEFSAAVELRQLFPGIGDIGQARQCVRTIAGWSALPKRVRPVRLRPDKAG